MICSDAALAQLEYPQLQQILAGNTQSEPGRAAVLALRPLPQQCQVEQALDEVDHALQLLQEGSAPSLGGCCDLSQIIERSRAVGSLIAVEDLQRIGQTLLSSDGCRHWFRQLSDQQPLTQLAAALQPLAELQRRLQDSIGSRGEILDSASFVLGDLRYRVRHSRSRIKQQLEQLLASEQYASCFQERLITQRNGRYVVPLKSDCRGQIKGFVQDESASGQTLYLEPTRVLDDNNRLQQLLREEQREEQRILLQLADLVRRDSAVLLANQTLLAQLDLRFAAARLSRASNSCRPQLTNEPEICLKQARHPLLMEHQGQFDLTAAVAIDLLLDKKHRALLISGPNTGGKSVALKTTGLLLLMLRSGLHLPCDPDSRIYLFEQLHVDIGDEQSISESLSTFSGHLVKLRQILAEADSKTLVLLDEAGSGTDPAEGAALIQALLEELCRRGTTTLATTHLGQLKHFAYSHELIDNAAVEFDPQTLVPTYRLCYGIPGASSALTTARRLGLPAALVERASEFVGQQEQDHSRLLSELHERQQQLDQQLEQLRQDRLKGQALLQQRQRQVQQLKEKKRAIIDRALAQADDLISATRQQLKQLRKRKVGAETPQQAISEKEQLLKAQQQLQPFRPQRRQSQAVPDSLQAGELVKIVPLGVAAEVVRVTAKTAELSLQGKRMRQPLTALEAYQPRRFADKKVASAKVSRALLERPLSSQLKLIGVRGDEAIARLAGFIDDARLSGLTQVEVVHGAGEGILRRLVRDYLAGQPGVSAFYAAAIEQGGDNVTIVELGS